MQRAKRWVCAVVSALALASLVGVGCKSDVMSTAPSEGGSAATSAGASEGGAETPSADGALRVGVVQLRRSDEGGPGSPSEAQVSGWLRDALVKSPEFADAGKGAPTVKVTGVYRAGFKDVRDGSGQLVGSVLLDVTLRVDRAVAGDRRTPYRAEAFVGEALKGGSAEEGLPKLVESVTREVAEGLVWQVRIERSDDAALVAMLTPLTPIEALSLAIDEARERKLKRAGPALVTLLKHSERDVVNRAASALGVVGSRDAVPALIDAGSRVEPVDRLPVLFALGELGGADAELYLETLAGSPEMLPPAVRQAARRALERARRGKAP